MFMMSNWHRRLELAEETRAPFGVGSFLPGAILLLGEQASDPQHAPEQQPFCSDKGCSGWLNRLLSAENIPEEKLFWVNVLYNDGREVDLRDLVSKLQPSAVIALGGTAGKQCEAQEVSHEKFYHPQYWKRFKSKQPYALLTRLKELTDDLHP